MSVHSAPSMLSTPLASSSEESVLRSRFSSSSDESLLSTGSIRLYTGDQYRYGAPHDKLRALPQYTHYMTRSSQDYQNFLNLRNDIDLILSRKDIDPVSCDLVHRWDMWQEDSPGIKTVLIQTKKTHHWPQAICDIIDLIYSRGHDNWAVEIIDLRAIQSSFIPELSPAFEEAWASIEEQILDFIGTDSRWKTLTLLNRGPTEADSALTVVIGLSKEADGDHIWQSLVLRRVRGFLQPFPGVKVSFIRSSLLCTGRGRADPAANTLTPEEVLAKVSVGASINIGRTATGTLGGFFRLRNTTTGQEFVMGSTCHHVIGNRHTEDPEEYNRTGYPPDMSRVSRSVCSPSKHDKEDCISVWKTMVDDSRNIVDGKLIDPSDPQGARRGGLKAKIEMLGEEANPDMEDDLDHHNEIIAEYEQGIAAVMRMDRRLGWIFASSGLDRYDQSEPIETYTADLGGGKYKTGTPMDWALIRIRNFDRIAFPNPMPQSDAWRKLGYRPKSDTILYASESDIEEGMWLFHKGRNGQFSGIASHIKTTIKFEDSPKYWKAWVVVGRTTLERVPGIAPPFMYGGDSGTWILDQNGRLRAQGFAGDEEIATGYIIPAKNLYRDVKFKTGLEIVEPRLRKQNQ